MFSKYVPFPILLAGVLLIPCLTKDCSLEPLQLKKMCRIMIGNREKINGRSE